MIFKGGAEYRKSSRITFTTADIAATAHTTLAVTALTNPLFKGQVLTLVDKQTGVEYDMTLVSDLAIGATSLSFTRITTTIRIRKGSVVLIKGANQVTQLRDSYYHRLHINAVYSPSVANAAKFYMGYGGHYNFNIGTAPWVDGGTKANNFATKWAWFSAIRECTIVETNIVYSSSDQTDTHAPFNTNFSLWGCAPTIDGTANSTMTELTTLSLTGNASSAYVQKTNSATHATLAAGSQLIPTFGPLSATPASTAPDFYAEIEVVIYCTQ